MCSLLTLLLLLCASTSHARTLLNEFNSQGRALHGEEEWEMSPASSFPSPSPAMGSCPPIALSVRRVDVTGAAAMIPSTVATLQCQTSSGTVFDPVTMRMWSANRVSRGVFTFNLQQHAALLGCGDAVSCRLSLVPANAVSGMDTQELIPWSVSSCWFLYSQFQEQGGSMWACQNTKGAQYVLQCTNCTGASGAGGGSSSSDNQHGTNRGYAVSPTVLIIVLCVGAVLAVSIFLAILAYARAARRSGRRAQRLSALRMGGTQDVKPVPMYIASSDQLGPGNLPPGIVCPALVVDGQGNVLTLALRDGMVLCTTNEQPDGSASTSDQAMMQALETDHRPAPRTARRPTTNGTVVSLIMRM